MLAILPRLAVIPLIMGLGGLLSPGSTSAVADVSLPWTGAGFSPSEPDHVPGSFEVLATHEVAGFRFALTTYLEEGWDDGEQEDGSSPLVEGDRCWMVEVARTPEILSWGAEGVCGNGDTGWLSGDSPLTVSSGRSLLILKGPSLPAGLGGGERIEDVDFHYSHMSGQASDGVYEVGITWTDEIISRVFPEDIGYFLVVRPEPVGARMVTALSEMGEVIATREVCSTLTSVLPNSDPDLPPCELIFPPNPEPEEEL